MLFDRNSKPLTKFLGLLIIVATMFVIVAVATVIFYSFLGKSISNLSMGESIVLQSIYTILMMGFPMIVYDYVFSSKENTLKSLSVTPSFKWVLLAMLLLFISNFLVQIVATPDNDEIIRSWSKDATIGRYVLLLIVVALLPAVCEELLFRKGIQTLLISITKNAFAGIILASMIFSLFHGDMSNFLARTILGFVLGIVYYYSKNLWVNITAHFLNNAFIVTVYCFDIKMFVDNETTENTPLSYVLALVSLLLIIAFILYQEKYKKVEN
ncbi:MAG: CPBP family intramembrane metalloprotease [Bacteroidales bacterium]|nr:CPBP family intramembrane metalloprotease [Bacteroidales bacterium]